MYIFGGENSQKHKQLIIKRNEDDETKMQGWNTWETHFHKVQTHKDDNENQKEQDSSQVC